MPNGPVEPPADLRAAAKMMFQMFTSLVQEGFSEKQALDILGSFMTGDIAGKQDTSDD